MITGHGKYTLVCDVYEKETIKLIKSVRLHRVETIEEFMECLDGLRKTFRPEAIIDNGEGCFTVYDMDVYKIYGIA